MGSQGTFKMPMIQTALTLVVVLFQGRVVDARLPEDGTHKVEATTALEQVQFTQVHCPLATAFAWETVGMSPRLVRKVVL